MKASEKLKRIKELQEKIKDINNKSNKKLMRDREPFQREEQKLKDSILNEKGGTAKEIRKDIKKLVDQMRKKYGKLKDLELTYHVLHFGRNVEICVDFEIPLESLIRRKEELEAKKDLKTKRGRKLKKKIVRDKK